MEKKVIVVGAGVARLASAVRPRPTLLQGNDFRPPCRSRTCRGLYFAGASVHLGAGVPIAPASAQLAVGEILRDDRTKGKGGTRLG